MGRLANRQIGRVIHPVDQTPSTNLLARDATLRGEPTGTVYLAEFQTNGRGRLGRGWSAEPGLNLTFSVILRPPRDVISMTVIAAAVALRRAVARYVSPTSAQIKWPNDLLLEGKKCAGMLLENVSAGETPGVVLGIGLNVNQTIFPPELRSRATSLLLAGGRHVPRAHLLASILFELEESVSLLDSGELDPLIDEYHTHMHGRGAQATLYVPHTGEPIEGRVLGISRSGALRLQVDGGVREFFAGDVSTKPSPEHVQ